MGLGVSGRRRPARVPRFSVPIEFDTFRVGVALAIVVGALSLAAPSLDALVLALVALASAGWAASHVRGRPFRGTAGSAASVAAFCAAGTGAAVYFLAPYPWVVVRGLLLALGFLPLWWAERRTTWPVAGRAEANP